MRKITWFLVLLAGIANVAVFFFPDLGGGGWYNAGAALFVGFTCGLTFEDTFA